MSRFNVTHGKRALHVCRSNPGPRGHAAQALAALLTAAAVGIACGGSSAREVDERYEVASRLAGSLYGQEAGAAGSGPSGQAGSGGAGGTGAGVGMPPPMSPPMPAPPAAPDAPSGPPQECNGPNLAEGVFGTPAPADGTLVDFATYTPRTATAGGAWGDMGLGQITGGTSVYSGDAASALGIAVSNAELALSASMDAMGDYAGLVLWFAPCVNASAFDGLSFPIRGELGGARMLVKAQASPNYPVDVGNTKGKCEYPREDMKFSTCQQPTATITELSENPLVLEWSEFIGGLPVATVDASQLLGFELQFQCQSATGCALDLAIGDVRFITLP